LVTLRVTAGEALVIVKALRTAPADHGATAHRLADIVAEEVRLGARQPSGRRRL
jgi:hypothetical protein